MNYYQTHKSLLGGSRSYTDAKKKAEVFYKTYTRRSKRLPYIRSAYFYKQKIFFTYFWIHLQQFPNKIKAERLQYLPAALELINKSRNHPVSVENPNNKEEILHRFYGLTKEKSKFCVQIKSNKRSGKKYFMSVFVVK